MRITFPFLNPFNFINLPIETRFSDVLRLSSYYLTEVSSLKKISDSL